MKRDGSDIAIITRGTREFARIKRTMPGDILLEYIANGPDSATTVNVGFDTGVNLSNNSKNIKIEVKASAYKTNGTNNILGAVRQNSWDGIAIYAFRNGEQTVSARLHTTVITQSGEFSSNTPFVATTYYDTSDVNPNNANQYRGKLIVNGQSLSSSGYVSTPSRSFNIIICGQNSMSSSDGTVYLNNNPSGIKTYYVKIWNDNNLIRFYIPVLHWVNNQYVACFYDKVNGTYVYNSGTDTPVYSINGDYVLDFIGAQPEKSIPSTSITDLIFDTGIVASTNLAVDTKCRIVYGRENYVFGSTTDSSTSPKWQTYGLGYPGALTSLRMNIGADSTTSRVIVVSDSDTSVNTLSTYYDSSIGIAYFNGTKYTNSNPITQFSSQTIHLFNRNGNSSNVWIVNGARIYYFNMTVSNVPSKTLIPVIHNNTPCFYDLTNATYLNNSGNSIYSKGNTTYTLFEKNMDILLDYIATGIDSSTTEKSVYFDTGFVPDVSTRCEVKAAVYYPSYYLYLFGAANSNMKGIYGFNNSSGTPGVHVADKNMTGSAITSNAPFTITGYAGSGTVYGIIDSSVVSTTADTISSNYPTDSSIYLFNVNVNGSLMYTRVNQGTKIYYFKIWDNNKLVRFYIPVLHWINNQYVACFYDKVNNNYIYNLGTDPVSYSVKNDYILDYISNSTISANTTGTSYNLKYDTGVSITTGLNFDLKFYVGGDNSSTGENYIFGTRSSTANKYALFAPNGNTSNLWFNVSKINASTNWSYGTPIKLSTYMNSSNIRCMYVDSSSYTGQQAESGTSDVYGTNLCIHGNAGNQRRGNRIYYFNIRNSNEVPIRNYVPVLHEGIPAYYDLNTNAYSYNTGTGTPIWVGKYGDYNVQLVPDSIVVDSSTTLSVPATSSTETISFTTDGKTRWSASSNQTWATLSSTSGTTKGAHSITVSIDSQASTHPYNEVPARTAIITLTCGSATATVTINQAAGTMQYTSITDDILNDCTYSSGAHRCVLNNPIYFRYLRLVYYAAAVSTYVNAYIQTDSGTYTFNTYNFTVGGTSYYSLATQSGNNYYLDLTQFGNNPRLTGFESPSESGGGALTNMKRQQWAYSEI